MNELLDIIVVATSQVFGVSWENLCRNTRNREIVVARRAASWMCKKEGIPARMLAERFGVSRWSINRMQTEARQSKDAFFMTHMKEMERIISTQKARKNR